MRPKTSATGRRTDGGEVMAKARPRAGGSAPPAVSRSSKRRSITDDVVAFYLASSDYNGMPAVHLVARLGERWKASVRRLVDAERIEVVTCDLDVNPHVKRLAFSVSSQLEALATATDPRHVCLYPHRTELEHRVKREDYSGRPYDLALALGDPQLGHRAFDLRVLEVYRADPRYTYDCDDLHGSISISDEHYRSAGVPERDKVLLNTFGFGYDEQLGRSVIAFNRYLADLTPEHQQIWAAHELPGPVRMHPDYFRTQVLGSFPESMPLCEAFFMELATINAMAVAVGRPPLFRTVDRPKRFGFLLRPTRYEFEQFIHLLDKALSDNLDPKFFLDDVTFERETERKDGRVQVERKGTLQVLEEWARLKFRMPEPGPFDEMMAAFREVRKLRQKPAHALSDDTFDPELFKAQRNLLVRAYTAVRTLRLLLTNHPGARSVRVEPALFEGRITSY